MSDFVTTLKQDKDKVTLTNADFIDKVINLKLFVANPDGTLKDTYVIRSDYELYYPDLMNNIVYNDMQSFISSKRCFIQKCQQKPSIKVQYKRVSANTGVTVDIFVI